MPCSLLYEVAIHLARLAVACFFLRRQFDVEAFRVKVREEIAGQLLDLAAIDDRPDQARNQGVLTVGAFRRRGEAETEGCDTADRRRHVRRPRQMMALVEHEQAIAIAPAFQMDVRGIVGRHGQRLQIVMTAADQTDRHIEGDEQFAIPLMQERQRRRHDESRTAGFLNGEDGEKCLAGSGRQHRDAARAVVPPGLQGCGLMRKRIVAGAQFATASTNRRGRRPGRESSSRPDVP